MSRKWSLTTQYLSSTFLSDFLTDRTILFEKATVANRKEETEVKRTDFEAHFATEEWVNVMFEDKRYPRYVKDEQTKRCQVRRAPDAVEPIGDVLLNRLLDLSSPLRFFTIHGNRLIRKEVRQNDNRCF